LRVSELAFVNNQTGVGLAIFYRLENLIERHRDVLKLSEIQLQREIRARHFAWDCDRPATEPGADVIVRGVVSQPLAIRCYDHGPVAVTHARAARQERVAIAHIRKGMN
jgi:hypothetical protein